MLVEIVEFDNTEIVDLYFAPDGNIYEVKDEPLFKIKIGSEVEEYSYDDIKYLCYAI